MGFDRPINVTVKYVIFHLQSEDLLVNCSRGVSIEVLKLAYFISSPICVFSKKNQEMIDDESSTFCVYIICHQPRY